MNIISGYRGEPHVSSQQERDVNIGIFGSGTYIVNLGSNMAATVISANEVQIADGLVIAEGCSAEIAKGMSESVTIENGTQGMQRKDLIVVRYTKDAGTGVEDMQLAVITGTPATASPSVPAYTTGSIANGDTLVEFPLYTVNIDGISIESVTRMVNIASLAQQTDVNALSAKIGTGTPHTTAKNLVGAVNELLPKVNANTSNVADARSRVSALETKTAGIVRTSTYNVSAGATDYKQLSSLATYLLIINAAAVSNNLRGIYLIGCTSGKVVAIKPISAASEVSVTDGGNGLLKVINNGGTTVRATLITTYDA